MNKIINTFNMLFGSNIIFEFYRAFSNWSLNDYLLFKIWSALIYNVKLITIN